MIEQHKCTITQMKIMLNSMSHVIMNIDCCNDFFDFKLQLKKDLYLIQKLRIRKLKLERILK